MRLGDLPALMTELKEIYGLAAMEQARQRLLRRKVCSAASLSRLCDGDRSLKQTELRTYRKLLREMGAHKIFPRLLEKRRQTRDRASALSVTLAIANPGQYNNPLSHYKWRPRIFRP